MIARVFWNPDWNDALFVTSCAERILLDERAHAIREIKDRATVDYARQFRLLLVSREGEQAKQEIVWISPQWNRQA